MGLFWDLLQQSQLSRQGERAGAIEQRVAYLEQELAGTRAILRDLIERLEEHVGKDLDRDGRIG